MFYINNCLVSCNPGGEVNALGILCHLTSNICMCFDILTRKRCVLCASPVITINVKDESFVPSKKQYDRVVSRFEETKLAFDTILCWTPHDERVCPSSVAEYLTRAGFEVELVAPHTRSVHKYNTRVPCLSDNKPAHVLEWLGAVALDCDMDFLDINSSSDMEVPAITLIWRGLYSSSQIKTLFQSLLEFIQEKSTIPWVSLNVHGFYNSLPCHHDQHFTILVDDQLQCTLYKATSR